MFSLIITIISIALVAALAVATIYYGGSAFTQGTAKANASALVSAGQQVTGALTLYANDNGGARATTTNLTTAGANGAYLSALPTVKATGGLVISATGVSPQTVSADGVETAICDAINASANIARPAAAVDPTTVLAPYYCEGAAGAAGKFVFKG